MTVFEAGPGPREESRASTFHPPTLDMLDALGAAKADRPGPDRAAVPVPHRDGLLAQFDFATIADARAIRSALQCEQSKLTRMLHEQLRGNPDYESSSAAAVPTSNRMAGRPRHIGRDGTDRKARPGAG